MGFLHQFEHILTKLPEVERPRFALTFKEKIKWTGLILLVYFILGEVSLYGLDPGSVDIFEQMRAVIAGKFGSLLSLGIGPLVTGSIILQILVGGKLVDLDLANPKDQAIFQGTQKVLAVFFTVFEACVMVLMGALPAANNDPNLQFLLILQLTVGGILIILMDEVVSKWGVGSGVGLFICAGVCSAIFIGAFNPFPALKGEIVPAGKIPRFIYSVTHDQPSPELLIPIIGTIIVFMTVVYAESVRVEIPLTYGRFRGARGRYPIKFIYASNIPVIFASILLANVQLWARMLNNLGYPLLGRFAGNRPISGLASYLQSPYGIRSVTDEIHTIVYKGSILYTGWLPLKAVFYVLVLIALSMLFSKFWVDTTGMDTKSVAKKLHESGTQIPGFRADIRIIEKVLGRYIPAVTLLGGAAVGLLAAFGNLTGALGGGMGVLLTVGILYNLYEEIAREQMIELHPMLRNILGK